MSGSREEIDSPLTILVPSPPPPLSLLKGRGSLVPSFLCFKFLSITQND